MVNSFFPHVMIFSFWFDDSICLPLYCTFLNYSIQGNFIDTAFCYNSRPAEPNLASVGGLGNGEVETGQTQERQTCR